MRKFAIKLMNEKIAFLCVLCLICQKVLKKVVKLLTFENIC